MQNTLFSTGGEAYHVHHIIHVSDIWEIPEQRRKGERTHAMKLVTSVGATFSSYKSEESAHKARAALAAMLSAVKPHLFRHRNDLIDARQIVSIGGVVALKEPQDELTHAVVASLATSDERNCKVWLKYKSEENASKGRRMIYAVVAKAHQPAATDDSSAPPPPEQHSESAVA